MEIQIITNSPANGSNHTTLIQRKAGQAAVKQSVQAGQKITLVVDGVQLTGAQSLAGSKVKLVKTDKNLVLQALDGSEDFVEFTNFYGEPNVVVTGNSWILADGSELQVLDDGVGFDLSQASKAASTSTVAAIPATETMATREVGFLTGSLASVGVAIASVGAGIVAAVTPGILGRSDTAKVDPVQEALAKIEAYNNGNGTTPAALTVADYEAAGVTGVTTTNLAAVNAQVLAKGTGGANTVLKVQTLVTAANTAIAKIEAYNNGDGITPAALTVADYEAAGVTGVTTTNLAAVNAQVLAQSTGGADTPAEVQALVTAADAAVAKIEAYNNGNGTTPAALTVADYTAAGVTGVTSTNLAAVNAQVLAQSTGGANSTAQVQALVSAANAAVAKIEAYNNGNGTTPAALTVADYGAAGVTGVTTTNLAEVNAQVLAQNVGGADTTAEVQALVSAVNAAVTQPTALAKIEAYNNGNGTTPPALTVADYTAAGVTGVTTTNLAAVNAQVLAQNVGGADTTAEVQALVTAADAAVAKIEAYNNGNGNGTTPAALTVADYTAAGVTGVTTTNLAAVNAQVLAQNVGGADTPAEVQALVTAADAAVAKIEAYNNGNGTTPAALTVADYTAAGVTGVTTTNLAAVNAQVLAQATGGADTTAEVQALVSAADAAAAKIEAYNNGNGTTPPALTVADYEAAGVTGVTTTNLAAVNAQVLAQNVGGADTTAEVQALVTAADAAVAKIEAYNNGNGTTPAALTVADYEAAGVTGVTTTNLAAVNAQVLAQATGGADTTAEVQALVTAADAAVAKIEAYNNGNGTTPAALTVADYEAAGVTGVTTTNLAAVNAQVLAQAVGGADTTAEVQALVTAADAAVAKIEAYNNGNGTAPAALTVADYEAAGVTGVTTTNLAAVNAQVLAQNVGGADTTAEVQALVSAADAAVAKIEAYNNGNGTAPAALTVADYEAAGVTGVTTTNLAAVNAQVLAQATGGADTTAEVQALVTAADAAVAKIEAYNNGNGTTPAALTVADYEAAGVTGVTTTNLAAVNAQVLAQNVGGADTTAEVQALVTAADAAVAKIEAYNNGNGTTPAALTVADYTAAGVTGVTTTNLAAVNAQVLAQNVGGADTTAEVQALVTAADAAVAKIEAYNNGDGTTPAALTVADYTAAGVTGVTTTNLAAVNAQVLAQTTGGADTNAEVQALVSAADAAVAKIEAYNNGNGTTPAALTVADYEAAGVTGVTTTNLAAVNAQVLAQATGGADTTAEVQALVTAADAAVAKIEAYNNGNGTTPAALTVADYTAAGVTGVTTTNLAAVNAQVLAQTTGGADTTAEVQALVSAADAAVAKIEAYNNGDGTTPAALTVADYEAAGVTGVTTDNLAAVNAQVLAQATGDADTTAEVQARVAAALVALAKIEAYNNGNGTTPAALTVADYEAVGVTGVTTVNLLAMNAQVLAQSTGGADTSPEVQALVSAANAAVAKIEAYNNGNGTTPAALTVADYEAAGVTGVTTDNLAAVNAQVLAQATGDADTTAEVQARVAAALVALAKIEAYNNGNGTTPAALTVADYEAVGVTGVTTVNLLAMNAQVLAQSTGGADTSPEVQALVSAANAAVAKIEAYNNGNGTTPPALTVADYTAAGVTDVTTNNLAAVNAQVLAQSTGGADTTAEVQALVSAAIAAEFINTISNAAEANNATGSSPALTDYSTAGVTGVTAGNLAAINSALNSAVVTGALTDTTAEIQAVVNGYAAILASADGVDNNATNPTQAQYTAIGVTGVNSATRESLLGDVIDIRASTAVDTVAEVQTLADAVSAVMTGAAGGTAPTLAQLTALGVPGVTAGNVMAWQAAIAATADTGTGVDTLAELYGLTLDTTPPSVASMALNAKDASGDYKTITSNVIAGNTLNDGGEVFARSPELGKAYLVKTTNTVSTVADIVALGDNQYNSVDITSINTDTSLSATGLAPGSYKLYVADQSGNLQTGLATTVNVVEGIFLGNNYAGSGINLNLIAPATMANGKTYYHVDQSGNGDYNTDMLLGFRLDNLLNGGADTVDTQASGAVAGVDDERTIVIGSRTLVLPTFTEMTALFNDPLPNPPAGWAESTYLTATKASSENHYDIRMYFTMTSAIQHDQFGSGGYLAFQVL